MPHCAWRAPQQCSDRAASRRAEPHRAAPLIPAALHRCHQIFTALAGARQGLGEAGVTVQKLSTGDGRADGGMLSPAVAALDWRGRGPAEG